MQPQKPADETYRLRRKAGIVEEKKCRKEETLALREARETVRSIGMRMHYWRN
jgi:hypothetical protein